MDDEVILLNENKKKGKKYNHHHKSIKNIIIIILSTTLFFFLIYYVIEKTILYNRYSCLTTTRYASNDKKKNDIFNVENNEKSLDGFAFLSRNGSKGPISIDKSNDDGTKLNLYEMIKLIHDNSIENADSDALPYNDFKKLEKQLPHHIEYFCELDENIPPEGQKGYNLICPTHYTIFIENAFYGHHITDEYNCAINDDENNNNNNDDDDDDDDDDITNKSLNYPINCGFEATDIVKELCEGKIECVLKPSDYFFENLCPLKKEINKYLRVQYHCIKDIELKKPKISVVMFANNIKVNSIYENSISEFFQYSQIHGYDYQLYRIRYDTEREIFYMKLNSVIESLIKGLKEKTYDWIFWVDSDTTIINPNIKLETFLPKEDMNSVHFIASDDKNGLNAGIYFIRVHPWSLNLLMRAMAYSYFNNKKYIEYADQSSLNNILVESKEEDHYVIVPQHWFNSHISDVKFGEFLIHYAGELDKDWKAKDIRKKVRHHASWYVSKTNKEMRDEVLDYYNLPKKEQHHIDFQKKK